MDSDHTLPLDLPPSWAQPLEAEFDKPYMKKLQSSIKTELDAGECILPGERGELALRCLRETPLDGLRAVWLGQDPYPSKANAEGLCFSIPFDVRPLAGSVRNIYKEVVRTEGGSIPEHGNLLHLCRQGVLLLNSVLTVREGISHSHKALGWNQFTDRIIEIVNTQCQGVVWMVWGNAAKKKTLSVDRDKHLVLTSGHPSPLSIKYFSGNGHFQSAREYWQARGENPVLWTP